MAVEITTLPVETGVATGDLLTFTDVSETPDALNAITVDNFFQPPLAIKSTSPTAGIGYAAGAGGTVTQSTNKATGVTLNKVCGNITMNNAALAAATIVSFVLTNSAITAGDRIVLNHESGGTIGAYSFTHGAAGSGTVTIYVRNNTAGSLSEAVVIGFTVIKSVTA